MTLEFYFKNLHVSFVFFPVMGVGLVENGFLTFRGHSDKQKMWGEMKAGEKEGKKGQRYKASDKCGQVSAGTHSLLKIYTSFWLIP